MINHSSSSSLGQYNNRHSRVNNLNNLKTLMLTIIQYVLPCSFCSCFEDCLHIYFLRDMTNLLLPRRLVKRRLPHHQVVMYPLRLPVDRPQMEQHQVPVIWMSILNTGSSRFCFLLPIPFPPPPLLRNSCRHIRVLTLLQGSIRIRRQRSVGRQSTLHRR